jgi:hypothetical protein
MATANEYAVIRDDIDDVALPDAFVHTLYGTREDPGMETQDAFFFTFLEIYLFHWFVVKEGFLTKPQQWLFIRTGGYSVMIGSDSGLGIGSGSGSGTTMSW